MKKSKRLTKSCWSLMLAAIVAIVMTISFSVTVFASAKIAQNGDF